MEQGDIALLFRVRNDLYRYEQGLRERLTADGIDVRADSGGGFYRRSEVVGVYRLLRFLTEYPNDVVTLHALESPYLRHLDLRDTVASILWYGRKEGHELTDKFEKRHQDLAAKFRQLRSAVRTETVPDLLVRMDDALGLRKYHADRNDPSGEEGLERLREVARSLAQSEQALNVGAFVRHLERCIRDDADGPELALPEDSNAPRPPYVRLMTVHAAKGLEFPVVFVPEVQAPVRNRGASAFLADEKDGLDVDVWQLRGVYETRSPQFKARAQTDKDAATFEEMRIFYVAVTRAQNHVILVGADTGTVQQSRHADYGWQDEVLAAKKRLLPLGCAFEESPQ
jgi:ATP-dependent exoDNAse (exonuclease V) beta subunit